ncbi:MAG: cytochrome c oxidase subunit II [Dehalococcoidia bacterium]
MRDRHPRRLSARVAAAGGAVLALLVTGCDGAFAPASERAEVVAVMWWVMLGVSTAVLLLVLGILGVGLVRSHRRSEPEHHEMSMGERRLVIAGGIALPLLVMVAMMVLTLWSGARITEGAPDGALRIEVVGNQWWWEVRYPDAGVVTANEVHIPVGETVELRLTSDDVIHSFWVPRLGGKMDLVPGRVNTLVIEADEAGEYRGQCAEFCGLQHARMGILVIAEPRDTFDRWLEDQRGPIEPVDPQEDALRFAGQQAFLGSACVYCHTIRGTNASGEIGPDLTHIASRRTLAAGSIPNTKGHLAGWVLDSQTIKPGNLMPPTLLEADQLEALLAFLGELR